VVSSRTSGVLSIGAPAERPDGLTRSSRIQEQIEGTIGRAAVLLAIRSTGADPIC
jgi:hypothetical protein